MALSIQQLYDLATQAGFPHDAAIKAAAIALKESGGNPRAFNGQGLDESYGLMQINMRGALGPARIREYGLASKEDLYDPATNMRAAYRLWGGDDRNFARHWGTEVEPYASRYRAALQRVQDFFGLGAPAAPVLAASSADARAGFWERDDVLFGAAALSVAIVAFWILDV